MSTFLRQPLFALCLLACWGSARAATAPVVQTSGAPLSVDVAQAMISRVP